VAGTGISPAPTVRVTSGMDAGLLLLGLALSDPAFLGGVFVG